MPNPRRKIVNVFIHVGRQLPNLVLLLSAMFPGSLPAEFLGLDLLAPKMFFNYQSLQTLPFWNALSAPAKKDIPSTSGLLIYRYTF